MYNNINENILYLKAKFIFNNELKIFTHLTLKERILLYKMAKAIPSNAIVVEIGSYIGSSSCFIAKGLKGDGKLICIDTWGNHYMKYDARDTDADVRDTYKEFVVNTRAYRTKIIEIRKWSTEAIQDIKNITKQIDFLFIDGDHNYEAVKKDWDLYKNLLKYGSFVAFHDTEWADGVQRVIKEDVSNKAELFKKLPNLEIYKIKYNF